MNFDMPEIMESMQDYYELTPEDALVAAAALRKYPGDFGHAWAITKQHQPVTDLKDAAGYMKDCLGPELAILASRDDYSIEGALDAAPLITEVLIQWGEDNGLRFTVMMNDEPWHLAEDLERWSLIKTRDRDLWGGELGEDLNNTQDTIDKLLMMYGECPATDREYEEQKRKKGKKGFGYRREGD